MHAGICAGGRQQRRSLPRTALSRHRDEARFYVSATPDFLNRAPEPLTTDDDLTGQVSRILATSRAEQLAVDGFPRDQERNHIAAQLERAREQLAEHETRVEALCDERAQTRWWQRGRRQEFDRISEGWQRGVDHWQVQVERLTTGLAGRPAAPRRALSRAHDPLAGLEPELDVGRELQRRMLERDRSRDIGLGMDR